MERRDQEARPALVFAAAPQKAQPLLREARGQHPRIGGHRVPRLSPCCLPHHPPPPPLPPAPSCSNRAGTAGGTAPPGAPEAPWPPSPARLMKFSCPCFINELPRNPALSSIGSIKMHPGPRRSGAGQARCSGGLGRKPALCMDPTLVLESCEGSLRPPAEPGAALDEQKGESCSPFLFTHFIPSCSPGIGVVSWLHPWLEGPRGWAGGASVAKFLPCPLFGAPLYSFFPLSKLYS